MEETLVQPDLLSLTKKNMEAYFKTHDPQYIAEDGVLIDLSTGEETHGRKAIGEFLHFIYHVAFDAHADFQNGIITTDKAMAEGYFTGKHIGEINGFAPTQKNVRVPLCVSYDLENGLIKKARVYLLVSVLMSQLTGE